MKFKVFITAALLVATLGAKAQNSIFAHTYQGQTLYYLIDSTGEAMVVPPLYPNPHYNEDSTHAESWWGYDKPQGAVAIPDSVPFEGGNYAVTTLGARAFQHCTGITSFTLPAGLRIVERQAFDDIPLMTTIELPAGVTSLGGAAFQHCIGLQSLTLPAGLTSLGINTFFGCTSLTSMDIPAGVTEIPQACFQGDTSLVSVSIPGVKIIGSWGFWGCRNLAELTLPEGLISIDYAAFANDSALRSIALPSSITYIGRYAFEQCTGLASISFPQEGNIIIDNGCFLSNESLVSLDIPSSVKFIGEEAFEVCSSLTSVTLHEGLEYLGEVSFAFCTALSSIVIPEGIDTIRFGTFANCDNLRRVSLPSTLVHLGDSVFIQGTPLDTLILGCAVPPTLASGVFEHYNTTLVVPCGSAETYRSHPEWGLFSDIIEKCDGIDEHDAYAGIKIHAANGRIIIDGTTDEVCVFDITGRHVLNTSLPSGVYLVRVGDRPAQKVLVER